MILKLKLFNSKKQNFKLQLLDSPRVERFRIIIKQYYKVADGIIFIYDVCDEASFKGIPKWFKQAKINSKDKFCKILVGNKCDKLGRIISEDKGKKLADKLGIKFFETSAKTELNIHEIFNYITNEILKEKLEELRNSGNFPNDIYKIQNADPLLKELLKEEQLKNQKLLDEMEALEYELNAEKIKNKLLEENENKLKQEFGNEKKEFRKMNKNSELK